MAFIAMMKIKEKTNKHLLEFLKKRDIKHNQANLKSFMNLMMQVKPLPKQVKPNSLF